ncbi:MAG: hypothetical protein WCT05_03800 [Lentisphaeria bacterium]
MFANNEKVQGVNTAEIFARMLGELPWANFRGYIQANAPLLKMCTFGGHRLEPQKRERLEKIVYRETEKGSFSEATCNGVFASWYPVNQELHQKLEDYFHSETYQTYRTENQLKDDEYVLSEEKFNEFFNLREQAAWKILLCFSPLKFSDQQADKILDETQGNSQLLEQIAQVERELEENRRKNVQNNNELEKLRARQQGDSNELQEQKKLVRNLKSDLEAMQGKFEGAQAEIKRLNQRLQDADSEFAEREKAWKEEMTRNFNRLQNEYNRIVKELNAWQSKYEEQRLLNRSLEKNSIDADKAKEQALRESASMAEKINLNAKFADLLLSQIDWPKIGAAMKMNPTVRRNFNSLIRKLNYEEDRSLTIEGTLLEFWSKLTKSEEEWIKRISQSNTLEVMNGDLRGFWDQVADMSSEVQINLEARSFLIGLLQELFTQSIELEDLKKDSLPHGKKK